LHNTSFDAASISIASSVTEQRRTRFTTISAQVAFKSGQAPLSPAAPSSDRFVGSK
jgi:hypothetical protein